ncbi:uncharacterized protein LOC116250461 [Nymphaea colorata]|uniref:uncharacterized protein LOC116250461 n=1 Tax=Nymphaea colorata TaxID=210225 RepID=UPI00129DABD9|nr:uncharacterized protein LOC116250461 [Nymphaea colorata]
MIPDEEWLQTSILHFDGEARRWYRWLKLKEPVNTWGEFKEALVLRFGESSYVDYDIELRNLRQTASVQEYQAKFENLASMVDWTPKSLIAAFVGGLKEEIQIDIRAEPNTELRKCFAKAPPPRKEEPKPAFKGRAPPVLTREEREELIKNKQCFWCKEKWDPTHKCKHLRVYTVLDGDADDEGEEDQSPMIEEIEELEAREEPQEQERPPPEGACHTMTDPNRPDAMRVIGQIGKRNVLVLLDSGATHNFVGDHLAQELKCTIEEHPTLKVLVANGECLPCTRKCANVELVLQKIPYTVDLLVVPLPSVDIILGVKWLKTLGRIWWDFSTMEMCLPKEGGGKEVVLRAVDPSLAPKAALKAIAVQRPAAWLVSVAEEVVAQEGSEERVPEQIQKVLDEFKDIFEEPKGLPPPRSYDHRIVLTNDTEPVNVRPYRYGYAQKSEIERLVKEMRESNIIRPSSSPFSSPVLLVKKKDNTWRFCVDYRALNEATVKDRHPIPVIDELLDELSGARIFSKLDLRSGYHQIRMYEEDISKTAFRTHDGHYEFLVMPFGLTNAPATFQRCMNDVFRQFLRDFVLVFFDDILVYSQSIEQHVDHLRTVLRVLRENTLFAKMSKCSFGQTSIGYLGHIVSHEGVRADPKKLQAMEQWPLPKDPRGMRGFLGLTGYYRRFIKGYGLIASPLTHMLKKGEYTWSEKAREAFVKLKAVMMNAPVLALPDFSKDFVIETDASDIGVGAVLSQEGHPIAFMSKALTERAKPFSTYEKELLAIVLAVDKWRPYLIGRRFVVRTDHSSLRYMFWWEGMKADVRDYVKACPTCQHEKYEAIKPPGHLNPLPIPDKPWEDVSMDFIDAMPRAEGKEAVLVVVDRLTKYSHFVALPRNYHGPMVANVYQDHVGKLHAKRITGSLRKKLSLNRFLRVARETLSR